MTEFSSQPTHGNMPPDRPPGGAPDSSNQLPKEIGSTLGLEYGFVLEREERVEDLDATAREYKHLKTGASVFFLYNDDPNAYFGIFFRTAAEQSTGIAHIAEHMAYRGSMNLPGTDPVNDYLRESLSSESNAATLNDHTLYYCASPHATDFRNQILLTLDAVFNPRLTESAFRQEAWRSERDEDGNPILNGIVLNEVRGYASDPLEVHNQVVVATLFPDTHYRFNFWGDPQVVPELDVEALRAFVKDRNHPSNCGVMVYGKCDRSEILRLLAGHFDQYEQRKIIPPDPVQPRFNEPVRITAFYPGDETEDAARDSIVSVSWRLGQHGSIPDALTLEVLESLILGEGNGTVKSALEEAGLGEQILSDGLDDSLRDGYVSIAVTGTGAARTAEIEETILRELQRTVHEGFPPETVRESIRAVLGAYLEASESSDRGDRALWEVSTAWTHGRDPLATLRWRSSLASLEMRLAQEPRYFEGLIQDLFLQNIHRATVTVRPDRKLSQQWAAKDTERAAQLGETPVIAEPTESTTGLIEKLKIADLEKVGTQVERSFEDGVWCYPIPRRELCSASLALHIGHIPSDLLPYIQVFGATFGEFHQGALPGVLGELGSSFHISESPTGMQVGRLILTGDSLGNDGLALLDTISKHALVDPLQDRRRLIQLMVEQKARFEGELQEDAFAFCLTRSESKLRTSAATADLLQGVAAFDNLRLLISEARRNWDSFSEKMTQARTLLLTNADPIWSLAASPKVLRRLSPRAAEYSGQFGANPADPAPWAPSLHPLREGFAAPSQVASTAVTFDLRAAGYQHHGSLHVLLKLIEHGRLWPEIRQRNGAYNALIHYSPETGLLTIGSRYDSRPDESITVAESIADWLEEVAPQIRQLRRGKIGAIGELDKPRSTAQRAEEDFLDRLSAFPLDAADKDRAQLFEAQAEHCRALAGILKQARSLPWSVTAIGSRAILGRLDKARGGDFLSIRSLEPRLSAPGSSA